jgi:DNA-binding response OmpR family regulator
MEPTTLYLIEDDAFLLDMYAQRFSQAGFVVVPKSNPTDALEHLRAGDKPQILITDLVMPGIDGFQLLEAVRTENLAPGAVIVVLSNLGEDEDIDRAVKLGALGYIVKATSTPSEVVSRVTQVYKEAQAHNMAQPQQQ